MTATLIHGEPRPEVVSDLRCWRRRWSGEPRCFDRAVVRLTGACVHEHVHHADYCADHAVDARSGKFACRSCGTCSEPHNCPVTVVGEDSL